MIRTFLFIVLISALAEISEAQVRAKTEDGKSVILFDDGTWKFEEESGDPEFSPAVGTTAIIIPAVAVDSTLTASSEPAEVFYQPSPRLVRYFGESGGNIRCKSSCSNNNGSVQIKFIWEIPVADGNRYFGSFKEGTKVIFTTKDDQQVELIMGDESDMQRLEKHNFSVISNVSYPLTQDQLAILTTQEIRKMEVDWRKKAEEYEMENSRFLIDTLPTVL